MSTNTNSYRDDYFEEKFNHMLTIMESGFTNIKQEIAVGNQEAESRMDRQDKKLVKISKETETIRFLTKNKIITVLMVMGFIYAIGNDLLPLLKLFN